MFMIWQLCMVSAHELQLNALVTACVRLLRLWLLVTFETTDWLIRLWRSYAMSVGVKAVILCSPLITKCHNCSRVLCNYDVQAESFLKALRAYIVLCLSIYNGSWYIGTRILFLLKSQFSLSWSVLSLWGLCILLKTNSPLKKLWNTLTTNLMS